MKKLEEVLRDFDFSNDLERFIVDSDKYDTYDDVDVVDSVTLEIEQQSVISTNNIYCSSI